MSEVAVITKEDLSLVSDNSLNKAQLQMILKKTPAQYIRTRPGKGGGQWAYVTGTYVRKVLNLMFGWDWDFEVLEDKVLHGEVIVKGRLTCRANGKTIIKTQYGNKDVICKRGSDIPLSIGNDHKAAATDALKKCAFELGIAQDVYSPDEFHAVTIEEITLEMLVILFTRSVSKVSDFDKINIQRIIDNKEEASYSKAYKILEKL